MLELIKNLDDAYGRIFYGRYIGDIVDGLHIPIKHSNDDFDADYRADENGADYIVLATKLDGIHVSCIFMVFDELDVTKEMKFPSFTDKSGDLGRLDSVSLDGTLLNQLIYIPSFSGIRQTLEIPIRPCTAGLRISELVSFVERVSNEYAYSTIVINARKDKSGEIRYKASALSTNDDVDKIINIKFAMCVLGFGIDKFSDEPEMQKRLYFELQKHFGEETTKQHFSAKHFHEAYCELVNYFVLGYKDMRSMVHLKTMLYAFGSDDQSKVLIESGIHPDSRESFYADVEEIYDTVKSVIFRKFQQLLDSGSQVATLLFQDIIDTLKIIPDKDYRLMLSYNILSIYELAQFIDGATVRKNRVLEHMIEVRGYKSDYCELTNICRNFGSPVDK